MNYLQSLAYLEGLSPTTQQPCLERVAEFMREAGQLQDRCPSIHVAGTNGKGSTVAMLDAVLRGAGMRVGRFTGPHLLRWNERFHVDGHPITDEQFADLASRVRHLSEDFASRHPQFGTLTWFEFLTVMAFFHFADSGVEVAVFEVGLGGRWDATNVLSSPLAVAITNVDLDHTQILGDTVRAIAAEKSGIIKPGVPVVTAAVGEALEVVAAVAARNRAPLAVCRPAHSISVVGGMQAHADLFDMANPRLTALLDTRARLSLPGEHQQLNALVVLGLLLASGLDKRMGDDSPELIAQSLSRVFWPGRFQQLPHLGLVLDGAHNPAGALALRAALDEHFPAARRLFVLGCFQNKDVARLIGNLIRTGDRVFACEATSRRPVCAGASIAQLCADAGALASVHSTVACALGEALTHRHPEDVITVTGSFGTVKESMSYLGWKCVEDGLADTGINWRAGRTPVSALPC